MKRLHPHARAPLAARLAAWLQGAWSHRGPTACLLYPLGALARWLTDRKRARHARQPERSEHPGVPVIVVGNLYVGGTGKTPLLLALIDALRARGWQPGVVSRGYGATRSAAPRVGCGMLDPAQFGDEPALISANAQAPVAVHPQRPLAARALLAAHPEVDVILSDDGLQHRALARDIELLVEDERGIGNGWVLPAGPLRESPAVRNTVDAIVLNGAAPGTAVTGNGPRLAHMQVRSGNAVRLADGLHNSLAEIARTPARIAAAAGIGRPERFFSALTEAGVPLSSTLALPDHHDFTRSPFLNVDADIILITEKDAVKCRHLRDARLWAVSATAQLADPHFFDWLHARLLAARTRHLLDAPPNGHTPA